MVAILVLLTVVGFLLADWVVQLVQVRRGAMVFEGDVTSGVAGIHSELPVATEIPVDYPPTGLFFHPGHCWAQIEREGVCRIGLDGLISQVVGRVDDVYLPRVGEVVSEGQLVASITQGSRVLSLKSPMDGVITEVNEKLKPRLLKSRPYSDGWLFTIRPKALEAEARRLMVGNETAKWRRTELQRIADYFATFPKYGSRLVYNSQTGAPILGSIMEDAPESEWQQFQQMFL